MNYYIADLHLGHGKILEADDRPISSVEEMDGEIVRRWRERVTAEDTVYLLGDFCLYETGKWPQLLDRLPGKKVLVRGNHDPRHLEEAVRQRFERTCDYLEVRDGKYRVILSHYPIVFHRNDYSDKYVMLYGHVHRMREYQILLELRDRLRREHGAVGSAKGNFYNTGAMMPWMDYTPRTLEEILRGDRDGGTDG